jgi:Flp pilus assembly secretin CpaC
VRTANDGIVLSGTVSSTAKLDRALDLASRYAPDRVSNLMVVGGTQQVMLKVRFAEMQRSVSEKPWHRWVFNLGHGRRRIDRQRQPGRWQQAVQI